MMVLVVEDIPPFANTIAEGLRDHGMAVDIAYDGLDAATKLNLTPYDVVVLDRDIPGIHGDALSQMIAASERPAMVLMLTAAGTPGERVAGLTWAPTTTLPNRSTSLSSSFGSAHSPAVNRAHSCTLRAAGIELDTLTRAVARDGRQLELSAKEFAVLEALIKASPGALSAENRLEQAWDETSIPSPRPCRSPRRTVSPRRRC